MGEQRFNPEGRAIIRTHAPPSTGTGAVHHSSITTRQPADGVSHRARNEDVIKEEIQRMIETGDPPFGSPGNHDKMASILPMRTIAEALAQAYDHSQIEYGIAGRAKKKSSKEPGTLTTPSSRLVLEELLATHIDRFADNLLARSKYSHQPASDCVHLVASDVEHVSFLEGDTNRAEHVDVHIEPGHYVKVIITQPNSDDPSAAGFVTPTPEGASTNERDAHHADVPEWILRIERYYLHPDTIKALRATGEIAPDDETLTLEDYAIPVTAYSNPLLDFKQLQRTSLSVEDRMLWSTLHRALATAKGEPPTTGKLSVYDVARTLRIHEAADHSIRWIREVKRKTEWLIARLSGLGLKVECSDTKYWTRDKELRFEIEENDVHIWRKFFEGTTKERIEIIEQFMRKADKEKQKQKIKPDSLENIKKIIGNIDSAVAAYLLGILADRDKPVHLDKLINRPDGNDIPGIMLFGHHCLRSLLEYELIRLNRLENTVELNEGLQPLISKALEEYIHLVNRWLTQRSEGTPLKLSNLKLWYPLPQPTPSGSHKAITHSQIVDSIHARLLNGPPHLTPATFHALRDLVIYLEEHETNTFSASECYELWESKGHSRTTPSARFSLKQLRESTLFKCMDEQREIHEIQCARHLLLSAFGVTDAGLADIEEHWHPSEIHEQLMSLHLFQKAPYAKTFVGSWQLPVIKDGRTYRKLRKEWEQAHHDKLTFSQRFHEFIGNQPQDIQFYAAKLLYYFVEHGKRSATWDELRNNGQIAKEHRCFNRMDWHYVLLCRARITYFDPHTRTMHLSNDFVIADVLRELELLDVPIIMKPYWGGLMGIHSGKRKVITYHEEYGAVPTPDTTGFKTIYNRISEGIWSSYEIPDWPTFIEYCGYECSRVGFAVYSGPEGVKFGQRQVLADYKETGEVPGAHAYPSIRTAIRRGKWKPYGITTWPQFLASIGLAPALEMDKWPTSKGLDRALLFVQEYEKEYGEAPIRTTPGMGGIVHAINSGYWVEIPDDDRSVATWPELLFMAGLTPREPFVDKFWHIWEKWCEKAAEAAYERCGTQIRLPNMGMPDLIFVNEEGQLVIADAKTHTHTQTIPYTIEKYIPFCDKMEIWCLFGARRDHQTHDGKQVEFLYPSDILASVKDTRKRRMLQKELKELRTKRANREVREKTARMKARGVRTLDEFLEEHGR